MAEQLDLHGAEELRLAADVYGPADDPPARLVDVADPSHMAAGDCNDLFSEAVLEFALPRLQANGG